MRIYKFTIEHATYGMYWDHREVYGRNFDEAMRKVKKLIGKRERIQSAVLIASAKD